MRRPVALTPDQAYAALAFLDCFDLYTTGAWRLVAEGMTEDYAIPDPEAALDDLRAALEN